MTVGDHPVAYSPAPVIESELFGPPLNAGLLNHICEGQVTEFRYWWILRQHVTVRVVELPHNDLGLAGLTGKTWQVLNGRTFRGLASLNTSVLIVRVKTAVVPRNAIRVCNYWSAAAPQTSSLP